jgi:hypothetical protein
MIAQGEKEANDLNCVIWISKNDIVFDKGIMPSYLQVLFRRMHWI